MPLQVSKENGEEKDLIKIPNKFSKLPSLSKLFAFIKRKQNKLDARQRKEKIKKFNPANVYTVKPLNGFNLPKPIKNNNTKLPSISMNSSGMSTNSSIQSK